MHRLRRIIDSGPLPQRALASLIVIALAGFFMVGAAQVAFQPRQDPAAKSALFPVALWAGAAPDAGGETASAMVPRAKLAGAMVVDASHLAIGQVISIKGQGAAATALLKPLAEQYVEVPLGDLHLLIAGERYTFVLMPGGASSAPGR